MENKLNVSRPAAIDIAVGVRISYMSKTGEFANPPVRFAAILDIDAWFVAIDDP
jgi:hypothetical protein